jgi:single-strand DNA-binding protein
MKTLNRVQLIGLLGADPKMYAMPSGTLVAKFCMATHYAYKDKTVAHVIKKTTEWHAVIVISDLAEIAERFLQKGACVYVDGSLKTREYQSKDQSMKRITEIVANDMIVLYGGKQELITSPDKKIFPVQAGGII